MKNCFQVKQFKENSTKGPKEKVLSFILGGDLESTLRKEIGSGVGGAVRSNRAEVRNLVKSAVCDHGCVNLGSRFFLSLSLLNCKGRNQRKYFNSL